MQQMTLAARDQQVIWHPYTQMQTAPQPIAITRGEGALLFDDQQNAYIDATSSWWVNIHGHAHPHIAEMLSKQAFQLQHIIFSGYTHAPAVELAERLLPLLPANQKRVFYSDNGSTAVEVALKMSLQYWDNKGQRRHKFIAFKNAYHGDTFGAMSVSGRSVFTRVFDDLLFEVHFIDLPAADNFDTLKATIEALDLSTIAAFIFEPLVQGAGGMLMYEAAPLDQLLAWLQSHQILLIADEVMTGFGRTGKNFAMENCSTQPDMICLSKGLTGGSMALGVTTCTSTIYDAFLSNDKLKTLFHGHSFTANPLACSVALASLDLFTDPACATNRQRIHEAHTRFLTQLQQSPKIKAPRLQGTILAFDIITTNADGYTNNIADQLHRFFRERRVMLRPLGNTLYVLPPYCITDAQLQEVYDCISDLLQSI
ncbi:adenosylmethionine-8-amino-7-oxononanoate aminotransferase [Chitinophaga jiangningensis]|uniref:Adenosylmethionine-8-amino-7-oxononanoate aminotransferase n=1 Tax=Chitinophaga jiangningensis TaxID=1419482 RepID=A0A1M7C728_9BACT|nr:adenosylmethionine--8-amino-7-oxononanoate transaminase [Chitinophaga jiangningensis]SHL63035.1 adenosylmethionine-8-amino-7-oxononanoate aminotransferase [Chitinophaga jiangningensis]